MIPDPKHLPDEALIQFARTWPRESSSGAMIHELLDRIRPVKPRRTPRSQPLGRPTG